MIEAAKTFEEYIKKENITGFQIREAGDERNTTIFESEIEVEERRPVAAIACEYGFLDLDRQGMVLNAHKQRGNASIPLLTGVTAQDRYIGDRVEEGTVPAALRYLSGLDEGELGQIVELRLSDPEKVVGCTVNAVEIRIGRLDRLDEKIKTTKAFLQDLRTNLQPIEFINMEYAQPFVRFR